MSDQTPPREFAPTQAADGRLLHEAGEELAFRKAMIAATLLAPANAKEYSPSASPRGANEVLRKAVQRATDLLEIARASKPRMIQAYQLFTPDENGFSPARIGARFKRIGWLKMTSPPTVREVLKDIATHARQRLAPIIELRSATLDYDPDRTSPNLEDVDLAEEYTRLALARLDGMMLGEEAEAVEKVLRSTMIQLLGKREHLQSGLMLDGYQDDFPYLIFLLTRCLPSEGPDSPRKGYFPYELFLYASAYATHLLPPVAAIDLRPESDDKQLEELKSRDPDPPSLLSDPIQDGLSPSRRLQDIWARDPVPAPYLMEGIVRRFGQFEVDLAGAVSAVS